MKKLLTMALTLVMAIELAACTNTNVTESTQPINQQETQVTEQGKYSGATTQKKEKPTVENLLNNYLNTYYEDEYAFETTIKIKGPGMLEKLKCLGWSDGKTYTAVLNTLGDKNKIGTIRRAANGNCIDIEFQDNNGPRLEDQWEYYGFGEWVPFEDINADLYTIVKTSTKQIIDDILNNPEQIKSMEITKERLGVKKYNVLTLDLPASTFTAFCPPIELLEGQDYENVMIDTKLYFDKETNELVYQTGSLLPAVVAEYKVTHPDDTTVDSMAKMIDLECEINFQSDEKLNIKAFEKLIQPEDAHLDDQLDKKSVIFQEADDNTASIKAEFEKYDIKLNKNNGTYVLCENNIPVAALYPMYQDSKLYTAMTNYQNVFNHADSIENENYKMMLYYYNDVIHKEDPKTNILLVSDQDGLLGVGIETRDEKIANEIAKDIKLTINYNPSDFEDASEFEIEQNQLFPKIFDRDPMAYMYWPDYPDDEKDNEELPTLDPDLKTYEKEWMRLKDMTAFDSAISSGSYQKGSYSIQLFERRSIDKNGNIAVFYDQNELNERLPVIYYLKNEDGTYDKYIAKTAVDQRWKYEPPKKMGHILQYEADPLIPEGHHELVANLFKEGRFHINPEMEKKCGMNCYSIEAEISNKEYKSPVKNKRLNTPDFDILGDDHVKTKIVLYFNSKTNKIIGEYVFYENKDREMQSLYFIAFTEKTNKLYIPAPLMELIEYRNQEK